MSGHKSLSRRVFLGKGACAVTGLVGLAYIVPSRALGSSGSVAANNRIVMGCIGTGGMGTADLEAFLSKSEVQMVAVCDVDANYRNSAKNLVDTKYGNKDCTCYNDFRELLARRDIDAVSIGTPDYWHAIQAILAARAGKDIHCQKPLAYTVSEGRTICDAVKKYRVVWQTGTQQRSQRSFRFACELVRNGYIGRVRTVEVGLPQWKQTCPPQPQQPIPDGFDYDLWLGPAPWAPYTKLRCHFNWRWIYDYAHGIITDWGAHHLDIVQWAMGTEHTGPVKIEGSGIFPSDGLWDVAYSYKVTYEYAEGFTLVVADTDHLTQGIKFIGTDGWVFVTREGMDANPKELLTATIGPNEIRLYRSDDHKGNFLDCVKNRSLTVAPVEVAHRSVTVGHLGSIAIRTRSPLVWDPVAERFNGNDIANGFLSRTMRSPWRL